MSRAIGNRYENELMAIAEKLNYATFAARGSRGPIDVLCFEDGFAPCEHGEREPHMWKPGYSCYGCQPARDLRPLAIQVGTTNKAISRTLDELRVAPRPIGSLIMVARRHRAANRRVSWTFHTEAGKFTSLEDAVFA